MFCGCPPSIKRCDAMDHCLVQQPVCLYLLFGKARTLLEWADATVGWKGDGVYYLQYTLYTPQTLMTFRAPTVLKNHVLQARESEVLAQSATVRIPDVQDSLRKRSSEDL